MSESAPLNRPRRSSPRRRYRSGVVALFGPQAGEPIPPRPTRTLAVFAYTVVTGLIGVILFGLSAPLIVPGAVVARESVTWFKALPSDLPVGVPAPERIHIETADGTRIATLFSEDRVPVTHDDLPQSLIDAVISTEDARFYTHGGIDPRGIARAGVASLRGGPRQGASTITQQYVKLLLLNTATTQAERDHAAGVSIDRKVREWRHALELEQNLTKDEILTGYLNLANFGHGAYGISAASRRYFSVPVSELTVPQAALLTGILKSPTFYNPIDHPVDAKNRRDTVINRMVATGALTPAEGREAKATPVELNQSSPNNGCATSKWPFYCELIRVELLTNPVFGEDEAARAENFRVGGFTIRTALNPDTQAITQAAVDEPFGVDAEYAAAAAVVEPGTGHVVALAQSHTYGSGEDGVGTQLVYPNSGFQPGSTFKAFTLATAVEEGFPIDREWDAPAVYEPENMNAPDGGFHNVENGPGGIMDAAMATWTSTNTYYVWLEEQVGVLDVADMAERMGISTLPRDGKNAITEKDASLTLGTFETSPLDLAAAYAGFAAHGRVCEPILITGIVDSQTGNPLPAPDGTCHQGVSPDVADTVTAIMAGTIDGPYEWRTGRNASIGRPAAGKTGSTDGFSAAWFAGYTPQYATAVWVGDPKGGFSNPLVDLTAYGEHFDHVYGSMIPSRVWKTTMGELHDGLPVETFAPVSARALTGHTQVVPDVRGLTVEDASRVLRDAGLTPVEADQTNRGQDDPDTNAENASHEPVDWSLTPSGRVTGTTPEPGAPARPGQQVVLDRNG